ncbi:hypothetical protein DL93DRAFT_2149672 [Clavulina sp. PMI_390]|nr:hypothetical protein DL93DRAFT_2149672 [Clavulina sp. PMI_390]
MSSSLKSMPAPSGNPARSRGGVVPTNSVTTLEGKKVKARIDPTLPVSEVVHQLCINLEVQQSHVLFALRDEQDQLVTDENLRKHIQDRTPLKLVRSPASDARDYITNLTRSDSSLKMSLFNLQKLIREPQFAKEFVQRDGLAQLMNIITINHGNTLAYALTAMRNLMDYDYGWATIEPAFIAQLCRILSNAATPINVCRPATSILKKLVEADPRSAPGPTAASSSRAQPAPAIGSVWRYGFDVVWRQVQIVGGLLEVLVQRLSNAESGMALSSMTLINTLLFHSTDAHWEELSNELQRLNAKKAVTLLMSNASVEELSSSILDFQANMIRLAYRHKISPVDPEMVKVQHMLDFIWTASQVDEHEHVSGKSRDISESLPGLHDHWIKIGFNSEHIRAEFARVGMLGLDCLYSFAGSDSDFFSKAVLEQLHRPVERRCPIAAASNEVVDLLADHWSVFSPGYSTSTTYLPFFLSFNRVHNYATRFFLRMWNESNASKADFPRVASLVESQIKIALANETTRPWHEVEASFNDIRYREVRERQLRELELQDELLTRPAVRNLRAKLHQESYEFVRRQRIMCLMQGAWFANGIPLSINDTASHRDSMQLRRAGRPWRFYRLDRSHKWLHYVESNVKLHIRPGLEDLPEKIEVSLISDVVVSTCASPPNIAMPEAHSTSSPFSSTLAASPLSFSLMLHTGMSAGDHVSESASRFSDWVDGLNMLRNSQITTRDTEMFVQTLSDIGLKIKLLDLSGEKVDIPASLPTSPPPTNMDFFFSEPPLFV